MEQRLSLAVRHERQDASKAHIAQRNRESLADYWIVVAGSISDQDYARARRIIDPVILVGKRVEGSDRS